MGMNGQRSVFAGGSSCEEGEEEKKKRIKRGGKETVALVPQLEWFICGGHINESPQKGTNVCLLL